MMILRAAVFATALLPMLAAPAAAHSLEAVAQQLSGRDKYFQPVDLPVPEFALEDAEGRVTRMTDLIGKVVVLNFIYASCGDVCPLHSETIAQVQRMVNETPMKDSVAFVSITTDPEHDRSAVLSEYGPVHCLDPVNWTFLTSPADQPEDATRQIAKAYGLEFTETEDGAQMHGLVTHVIDRGGRLRGRFHGLRFEAVSLVTFVNALVNDVHKPGDDEGEDGNAFWSWFVSLFAPPQGEQQ